MIKPLTSTTKDLLLSHVLAILTVHRSDSQLGRKMAIVDIAYAMFRDLPESKAEAAGVDVASYNEWKKEFDRASETFVDVNIPVIASQVDTFVAYASEVYLSGVPIFPVVTDPKDRKVGSYIEAVIDKHSRISKYSRELQMFFRDCAKYNLGAVLCEWETIQHYIRTQEQEVKLKSAPSVSEVKLGYNKLTRVDPYNLIMDRSVLPGDVAAKGDYVGQIELLTMGQLRRKIRKLKESGVGVLSNETVAMAAGMAPDLINYTMPPQITDFQSTTSKEVDWASYAGESKSKRTNAAYGAKYEVVTLYMRMVPEDFHVAKEDAAAGRKEGIYKITVVNSKHIVHLEEVFTAFEHLPILVGQPTEDGLGLQTQSIAERAKPMQEAASGLVNIRFHAARRSIVDRALYDENMIDAVDVNNPIASAKIPVSLNSLVPSKLSDAYHSIPFQDTATNGMLGDAIGVTDWSADLAGYGRSAQGRFTKGNRTQGEFDSVQSSADQRSRLPIITLEFQVFVPLKQFLLLNIMRYSADEVVQHVETGEAIQVDINELTQTTLDFKVADGFTPKDKLANSDMLTLALNTLMQSPQLAQMYGASLPGVFDHILRLGGINGIDQYAPAQQALPAGTTDTTPNLDDGVTTDQGDA